MQVTCINNTIPARWAQLINVIETVQTCPKEDFRVRVARHWWKGLRCCAIQVPKRLASPIRVWEPFGLRVPPLILRAMTSGRTLRSARLLWEGTPGTAAKTKSSGKNGSTRSHKVCWGAVVWVYDWQSFQRRCSKT